MLYIVKLIYYWLLPPGIIILLALVLGMLCRKQTKKCLLYLPALLLFLVSIRPVSNAIIQPLETAYSQPSTMELKKQDKIDAIVVLGGGSIGGVQDFDGVGQVPGGSANRLLAGVRLHKAIKKPIILSGGTVFAHTGCEADIEHRVLKACGIKEKYIFKEAKSRNTVENARFTHKLCNEKGFKRVLLVTSAFHMPRSVEIFKREGMDVIPYPTDYRTDKETVYDIFAFVPSAYNMDNVTLALKEYLGIFALKLNLQ